MAVVCTSSHCLATLLLSGDRFIQAVWLLSGSLHTLSFCVLFTYICSIYIVNCFSNDRADQPLNWSNGACKLPFGIHCVPLV